MIGLSKKDKEEILEFPKKYGVILSGMHQEMTRLKQNVKAHNESFSKARDELKEKVLYTESENQKLHEFVVKTEQRFSQSLFTIDETIKLIKGMEMSVNQPN